MKKHYKSLKLDSGLHISVQASKTHYSIPRNGHGPYTHVELGPPSIIEPIDIMHSDRCAVRSNTISHAPWKRGQTLPQVGRWKAAIDG